MRVLVLHNYYQQPGGEDQIFAAETRLLEAHGNEVIRFTMHNDVIRELGPLHAAKNLFWNSDVYAELRGLIRKTRPQVMHSHNTFPLISPAAYGAARDEGIPVVQTLQNFRLVCANAFLFREAKICEDCIGRRVMWPAVWHRCYRGSAAASAAVIGMLHYHRVRGTWSELVHLYLAPTEFVRGKLIEGGLPPEKVLVKPNFVDWNCVPPTNRGKYMLFVGRLSPEKGVRTLLAAWSSRSDLPPLRILGDGPLREEVQRTAAQSSRVQWLGHRSSEEVQAQMQDASALLFPSEWYEAQPLVVIEAYAAGLAVIGSAIGAAASLIEPGRTGLLHAPGEWGDLADKVLWAWKHGDEMRAMGATGRARFEERYTPAINYRLLRDAYACAAATWRDVGSRARSRSTV